MLWERDTAQLWGLVSCLRLVKIWNRFLGNTKATLAVLSLSWCCCSCCLDLLPFAQLQGVATCLVLHTSLSQAFGFMAWHIQNFAMKCSRCRWPLSATTDECSFFTSKPAFLKIRYCQISETSCDCQRPWFSRKDAGSSFIIIRC